MPRSQSKALGVIRPLGDGIMPGCVELSKRLVTGAEKRQRLASSGAELLEGDAGRVWGAAQARLDVGVSHDSKGDKDSYQLTAPTVGEDKKKKPVDSSDDDDLWGDVFDIGVGVGPDAAAEVEADDKTRKGPATRPKGKGCAKGQRQT